MARLRRVCKSRGGFERDLNALRLDASANMYIMVYSSILWYIIVSYTILWYIIAYYIILYYGMLTSWTAN